MAVTIEPKDIEARAQLLIQEFHAHYQAVVLAAATDNPLSGSRISARQRPA